jgi:hypothetical protein
MNLYNRQSCRSPMPMKKKITTNNNNTTNNTTNNNTTNNNTTNNILNNNNVKNTTNNILNNNVKNTTNNNVKNTTNNNVKNTSGLYDKQSCRSVKRMVPKEDYVYKVVTENPVGKETHIPESRYSFIKYTAKPNMFHIQPKIKIRFMPYHCKKKYPFDEALDIYENNQAYYLNKIEKYQGNKIQYTYIRDAEKLERWFYHIVEAKPIDETDIIAWEERNEFKKIHNYSSYCDKEIVKYYTTITK